MNIRPKIRRHVALLVMLMGAALAAPVLARAGPGGVGHGGVGGHGGGFGGRGGSFGGRGGFGGHLGYGGFHRGYGYHAGYGHWRGGYGYGGWGWPGYGLLLSALPFYYSTLWWDGVPYYYADDNYYMWDGSAGGYEVIRPPPQVVAQVQQQTTTELFAYPKNGQSTELQAQDREACQRWATTQAAVDSGPSDTAVNAVAAADGTAAKRGEYLRAEAACLEARGYSVK